MPALPPKQTLPRPCLLCAKSGHETLSPLGHNEFAGVGHAGVAARILSNRRDHQCSEYKFYGERVKPSVLPGRSTAPRHNPLP